MANPRRRRRTYRRRPTRRRRRRRNSAMGFTSQRNPLILSNPRRRRRRSNPRLNLKTVVNKVLTFGGGGALAYAANQFGLRNIENDWLRRGAQAATAVAGSMFLKGEMGAAFAGGMMYPLMSDLALMLGVVTAQDYDVAELSAELENALGEGGYLDGVDLEDTDELYIDGMDEAIW